MVVVQKHLLSRKAKPARAVKSSQAKLIQHHQQDYENRIGRAMLALKESDGALSLSKASQLYDVSKTTLFSRLKGRQNRAQYYVSKQLLTSEEEAALKHAILQLQAWGWPPRVSQLRQMASTLLQAKGEYEVLGTNWAQSFLSRHPDLQAKYSRTLDQTRFFAEDTEVFQRWFSLYHDTIIRYGILEEDTYNMDEKGFMMGVAGSVKVVISKYERQAFVTHSGNREWVSLIESISAGTGRKLPLWVIFKGVQKVKAWYDYIQDGFISTSHNGWTDNELGYEWLVQCFEPDSAKYLVGEYRLLLVDGHESHISTEFIKFCGAKKIILLCLPPHTTHLLQPLDVGCFGPLAYHYKKELESVTQFNTVNVDKADFLKIVQKARKLALTSKNIQTAWRATGLIPYNPAHVLDKLAAKKTASQMPSSRVHDSPTSVTTTTRITISSCPGTPKICYTSSNGNTIRIENTPANVNQVDQLIHRIHEERTLDTPRLHALEKLVKGAKYALAASTLLRITNQELITANTRKQQRANRSGAQYSGDARVLSLEDVNRRKQWAIAKQKEQDDKKEAAKIRRLEQEFSKAFKELGRLGGPGIIGPSVKPKRRSFTKKSTLKTGDKNRGKNKSESKNEGKRTDKNAGKSAGKSAGESAGESGDESAGESGDESAGESGDESAGEGGIESADESGDESAGESGNESAGESKGESAGESGGKSAGESGGKSAGESGGESAGESGGESGGESRGESGGESRGESAGKSRGESAGGSGGESAGESAGGSGGESAGESADESASESRDESAGESRDKSAGESGDKSAGESADESADESAGESADESAGESADKNAGKSRDKSAGESRDKSAGESGDESAGESRGKSAGESADESAGKSADKNASKRGGKRGGKSGGESRGKSTDENGDETADESADESSGENENGGENKSSGKDKSGGEDKSATGKDKSAAGKDESAGAKGNNSTKSESKGDTTGTTRISSRGRIIKKVDRF